MVHALIWGQNLTLITMFAVNRQKTWVLIVCTNHKRKLYFID